MESSLENVHDMTNVNEVLEGAVFFNKENTNESSRFLNETNDDNMYDQQTVEVQHGRKCRPVSRFRQSVSSLDARVLYGPYDFKKRFNSKKKRGRSINHDKVIDFIDLSASSSVVNSTVSGKKKNISYKEDLYLQFCQMFPNKSKNRLMEAAKSAIINGEPHNVDAVVNELLCEVEVPTNEICPNAVPHVDMIAGNYDDSPSFFPNTGAHLSSPSLSTLVTDSSSPKPSTSGNIPASSVPSNREIDDGNEVVHSLPNPIDSWIDKKHKVMVEIFPLVDPDFLYQKISSMLKNNDNKLNELLEIHLAEWIQDNLEKKHLKSLPSRADYEKKKNEAKLIVKYSTDISVEEFTEAYDDDPVSYFYSTNRVVSDLYKLHSMSELKRKFFYLSSRVIIQAFETYGGLFVPCCQALEKFTGKLKKRERMPHKPDQIDVNFLEEFRFYEMEADIKKHMLEKKKKRQSDIETARIKNELLTCNCCFSDDCLKSEMFSCSGGTHFSCRDCIQRASKVAFGDGKTKLSCLQDCGLFYELVTLQSALKAPIFCKWLKKIQLAEVKQAGIDGLEQCPFCDFATILETSSQEDKVFQCLNEDCRRTSCRLCHEASHIPMRCDEIERDAQVVARTFIENKMTEALIRTCYKCKKPFVKSDGCNKIHCSCGAQMCYVCRKPVRDYTHFYGQGAEETDGRCPLWDDNTNVEVAQEANNARIQLRQQNMDVDLLHDPIRDMEIYHAQVGLPLDAYVRAAAPMGPRPRMEFHLFPPIAPIRPLPPMEIRLFGLRHGFPPGLPPPQVNPHLYLHNNIQLNWAPLPL